MGGWVGECGGVRVEEVTHSVPPPPPAPPKLGKNSLFKDSDDELYKFLLPPAVGSPVAAGSISGLQDVQHSPFS